MLEKIGCLRSTVSATTSWALRSERIASEPVSLREVDGRSKLESGFLQIVRNDVHVAKNLSDVPRRVT